MSNADKHFEILKQLSKDLEGHFALRALEATYPKNKTSRAAHYQKLFGLTVGSLLAQIVYWHLPDKKGQSRLRVQKLGWYWVAKTREEWMEECSITLDQYCRAIAVLRRMGLIEVRQMKFHALNVTHVRLIVSALVDLMKELSDCGITSSKWITSIYPHRVRKAPDGVGQTITRVLGKPSPRYWETHHSKTTGISTALLTEITSDTTPETICCDTPSVIAEEESQSKGKTGVRDTEKEKLEHFEKIELVAEKASTLEIPKEHAEIQQKPVDKISLVSRWQTGTAEHSKNFQKVLTYKELRQLKMIAKALGEDAAEIISFVIEKWSYFTSYAKSDSGKTMAPTEPHVGYLLAHCASARKVYLQSSAADADRNRTTRLIELAQPSDFTPTVIPDKEKPFKPPVGYFEQFLSPQGGKQ